MHFKSVLNLFSQISRKVTDRFCFHIQFFPHGFIDLILSITKQIFNIIFRHNNPFVLSFFVTKKNPVKVKPLT